MFLLEKYLVRSRQNEICQSLSNVGIRVIGRAACVEITSCPQRKLNGIYKHYGGVKELQISRCTSCPVVSLRVYCPTGRLAGWVWPNSHLSQAWSGMRNMFFFVNSANWTFPLFDITVWCEAHRFRGHLQERLATTAASCRGNWYIQWIVLL